MAVEVYPVKLEKDIRDDERRKVIAELTSERLCNYILDELVVEAGDRRGYTSDKVPFANWNMRAALRRALARASLLDPEGEGDQRNDKDLPADSAADKSAIRLAAPSSERARAGDPEGEPALDELRAEVAAAQIEIRRMLAGFDLNMGALREQLEDRGHRPIVVSIALNGMLSDGGELEADGDLVLSLRPALAHEERSAHG